MKDGEAERLRATLISATGRMVSVEEMRKALGLKPSTYYDQVREGRLISLDNLTTLAQNLGINTVWLLVDCGLLDRESVEQYYDMAGSDTSKPLGPMDIRRER